MEPQKRDTFVTRFGMIWTLIGVAVGLGNVWRFPYMAGMFGGGAFLLLYILIIALFGVPALMAEYALGRHTERGPLGAFSKIGMPGGKIFGWLLFITVLMATSYYTVVIGWVLWYMIAALTGKYIGVDTAQFFDATLGNFWLQFWTTAVVIVACAVVLWLGISKGIEKVSKYTMPGLFVILLILVVRSVTLPGAVEGLKFYLIPDLSKLNWGVLMGALGQVFFSLSLGGTFLMTYASYMKKDEDIPRAAKMQALGDTGAAILAGFAVLPAVFAFGLKITSGPPLIFITMPSVFARLPAGAIFGAMFFLFLFVAAYLSDVAAFEVLVAALADEFKWSRRTAIIVFACAEMLLAIPSMLDVNFLIRNDVIWGSTMQPIGSAITMLALAWVLNRTTVMEEVNRGASKPVGKLWYNWIKYVVPAGILIIVVTGLQQVFATFFQ